MVKRTIGDARLPYAMRLIQISLLASHPQQEATDAGTAAKEDGVVPSTNTRSAQKDRIKESHGQRMCATTSS